MHVTCFFFKQDVQYETFSCYRCFKCTSDDHHEVKKYIQEVLGTHYLTREWCKHINRKDIHDLVPDMLNDDTTKLKNLVEFRLCPIMALSHINTQYTTRLTAVTHRLHSGESSSTAPARQIPAEWFGIFSFCL